MAASFVQANNARGAVVNSLDVVVNGVTAGNTLIATYSHYESGAAAPVAPTSSPSNTWTRDVYRQFAGTGLSAAMIASAPNVASGNTTVTFDSGTGFYGAAAVAEFGGMPTSAIFDVSATNDATSSTPTSGTTATTAQADALAIACMVEATGADSNNGVDVPATFGGTATGGTPANIHVEPDSLTYIGHASDYKVLTGTGTVSAAWGTMDGSYDWAACIAVYKATAGGGGGGVVPVLMKHYRQRRA